MHILFLGWANHVHTERWAGWFARNGYRVSVVSVAEAGRYPPGVRQYRLDFWPKRLWPGTTPMRLRKALLSLLLARLKPDVVHVHWVHFAWILKGRWQGPTVITAWGSDVYKLADAQTAGSTLPELLNLADLVTCDARDVAAHIRRLVPDSPPRIEVVQWGVDTGTFAPAPQTPRLRRELDLGPGPVLLSPRNFTPLYHLDVIVSAFAQVLAQHPQARLLMKCYRSQPDYRAAIEGQIKDAGLESAVHILEEVPYEQMPDFYRSGDLCISVPESDATPMSLLEAMACGCVPVVSDLPALREWVIPGENGFLVPAGDADALAKSLLAALADREQLADMGIRNRELVATRASQDAEMGRVGAYYRELLGRAEPSSA